MKAGQTDFEVGTRVQLENIKGEDKELNGLIGTITHPFAFGETKKGWVGIHLEGGKATMPYGGQCNVKIGEFKVLD